MRDSTITGNRRGITIRFFRVGVPQVDSDLLTHIILSSLGR